MEFFIPESEIQENIVNIGKKIGYFCIGRGKSEAEFSFIRPLDRRDFPRFHLFIRKDKGKNIRFNLHLDQKKPSYGKYSVHNAEYESPLIENEASRIKSFFNIYE